ncbi:hypothetical protein PR003_g24609 [Phytophthora rubi]|uniref:Uncharacterized protein n=1 Tax=Phytophthora rubi TaxID=129364 RepID=A0A6A4CPW0_9STRA|nr:hypothetical protein PR002_g23566 [Phytophthora rubi]KAE8982958.1 hypothetical protein PR001_g23581 [Phytophthora rubi]KAE9293019.1 hypothetical protein PR003_g24609 [Phytophthora rubi]
MICVVIGLTCSASRSHSLTTSAASKITLPPNRQLQRPKSPKPKRASGWACPQCRRTPQLQLRLNPSPSAATAFAFGRQVTHELR